jgi:succinate dehydrogenase/fumarate reductase flavoprotein subunit
MAAETTRGDTATQEYDVVVVGAGIADLYALYQYRNLGFGST